MFFDRARELAELESIHRRQGGQFVAVFGRRRIGKTALLTHWLRQHRTKDDVYWVAYRSSSRLLLSRFSQAVQKLTGNSDPAFSYSSWEAAFEDLGRLVRNRRRVVVIDEWPYLAESVPGIASILQAAWDHHLKDSKVVLVLAGSHYHMMHDELLSPHGALYGRTTANLLLGEIAPSDLRYFLPRYSWEQIVEVFSIVGGVPKYLELWNDRWPVMRNIEEAILSPVTIFRQEPSFLIQDEIAEPRIYLSILEAIGAGMKTASAIARMTGIPLSHAGKYLHTLQFLKLTRREVSMDVVDLQHSRVSRYEIADPYLRFHFTFIRPNASLIEQGLLTRVVKFIRERFDAHVAKTGYEELCRRLIVQMGEEGELPFEPQRAGRVWDRTAEIDVAVVDLATRSALLGECKWSHRRMGLDVLAELKQKAKQLRRLQGFHLHFALFSRSGFESPLIKRAKEDRVMLFHGLKQVSY